MRLTFGSYIIDGTAASSTTTSAVLRLDFNGMKPRYSGGELRCEGFTVFVEAANEPACKTAVEAIETQFRQANGKTVTFYNTTGTALWILDTALFPEIEVEYEIDEGGDNARIDFTIIGRMPDSPVSGGAADEAGQRGEIEWDFEIGPNGLTSASATAEFGPSAGGSPTAIQNAATWIAKLRADPPTGLPAFLTTRLRVVHVMVLPVQKPNQATIASGSYDPVTVNVVLREVYSGIASIPTLATDLHVNTSLIDEEPMDTQAGETNGPSLIGLSGYFTILTEDPTEMLSGATKVARADILTKAREVYDAIEADWRTIHSRFTLAALADVLIEVSPDSGVVTFSRVFSTTFVRKWREKYTVRNIDPVIINRDYSGADTVHHGMGGPVVTLSHSLYIEVLNTPKAYQPPRLGANWVRLGAEQEATVSVKLRGGVLVHITQGASDWRYAQPNPRGPSDRETFAGKVITPADIGDGTL